MHLTTPEIVGLVAVALMFLVLVVRKRKPKNVSSSTYDLNMYAPLSKDDSEDD